MSTVDLHIHSSVSSDGEFTPAQIVKQAEDAGLSMIAVTDHNSVRGVKEAMDAAADLTVIPGIEIDCAFEELNLHVLGYGIDINDPAFTEIEKHAAEQEENAFPAMIRKLQALGFDAAEEEVRQNTAAPIPAAEDIAEVLLADPARSGDARLAPYRPGGTKSDMPFVHFYYDWCAKGKPAYAEKHFPELERVIAIIKNAGGVPVLAHPGASLPAAETQLPEIIAAGTEGVEVFSSYHSAEQTGLFLAAARKHNLLITCGSDFHGKNKPGIRIGSADARGLDAAIMNSLYSARRNV